MNMESKLPEWSRQVSLFSEQNYGRPTRLGVFEPLNYGVNDYWLEDGLPLDAVHVDTRNGTSDVSITVGGFTHSVNGAKQIDLHYTVDGTNDGIDVVDSEGRTSILRFEA